MPHAWASTGAMPKSSSAAKTNARADRTCRRRSAADAWPRNVTFGPALALARPISGPSPITTSRRCGMAANASTIRSTRLYGTSREAVT